METEQELLDRIRVRLEKDADVLRLTDRKVKAELLYRVAKLAAEEAQTPAARKHWADARTRPLAHPDYDDPRDVLIGRLARVLDVADGGHHAASYHAILAAAHVLQTSGRPIQTPLSSTSLS